MKKKKKNLNHISLLKFLFSLLHYVVSCNKSGRPSSKKNAVFSIVYPT